jgi:hypothetical protein
LRWNLHDVWPELEVPARALSAVRWQERITARLARAEQTTRVRIARDELRRVRELTRAINELKRELAILVAEVAPQLLAEPGCGVLIAAKFVGEIAGVRRFDSDAKLARLAGSAPVPASSGRSERHRLDPALHRARRRVYPPAHELTCVGVQSVECDLPAVHVKASYDRHLGASFEFRHCHFARVFRAEPREALFMPSFSPKPAAWDLLGLGSNADLATRMLAVPTSARTAITVV